MATSKNKSLGMLLVALLIILIIFQFMPFLLGPFHMFPKMGNHTHFNFGPEWQGRYFGFLWFRFFPLALLFLWIVVIIWVYRDAESRGMNGLLWALLVFVGNLIGLIVYLIVRSGVLNPSAPPTSINQISCPKCGKQVPENFAYCPYCGAALHAQCPSCGREIQPDWKVCPHCGTKLTND